MLRGTDACPGLRAGTTRCAVHAGTGDKQDKELAAPDLVDTLLLEKER